MTRFARFVSHGVLKRKSPLSPASSDARASLPIGGRVSAVASAWIQRRERQRLADADRPGGRQAGDRRRGDSEEAAQFVRRGHVRDAVAEEIVRIEERHAPRRVVDRVVLVLDQLPAVRGDLLAAGSDLQSVERDAVPVAAALRVEEQVQLEHRRRSLTEEQVFRSDIHRIVACALCQAWIAERLRVRKDEQRVLNDDARSGVAGAWEGAVLDVIRRLVGGERESEEREIRSSAGIGPLRAGDEDLRSQRRADHRTPGDTIDLAHFVVEDRRVRPAIGQVDQPKLVVLRRVVDDRQRTHLAAALRRVAHGEVVARIDVVPQREPEPRWVDPVIDIRLEQPPPQRADPFKPIRRRRGDAGVVRVRARALARHRELIDAHLDRLRVGGDVDGAGIEHVDRRKRRQRLRIDDPEETPRFVVEVALADILRRDDGRADRVVARLDVAPLLRRQDRPHVDRPEDRRRR